MSRSTVLVVGGGPAGSTTASLLARAGVDVTLFEREHFPRYHIGESILPACHPVLNLIGAREKVAARGFHVKTGQYFQWGKEQWDYRFGALSGNLVSTWQVERAEFDQILLENSAEQGAEVHQGRRVTGLDFDGDRPVAASWTDADGTSGRHEFDYLVDCSGRAGLMVNRYLGGRQVHESFRNVAVWGYWHGGNELPDAPPGATYVAAVPEGWVWVIPLRNGVMSVGVVMHKRRFAELRDSESDLERYYLEQVRSAAPVPEILADARFQGKLRTDQDYSYSAERFSGPGYFISGDSACFLDPLLSSGVHLAMFSALLAAASICSLVHDGLGPADVARFYDESYRRTYLRFLVVVAAVYRQYDAKETYFWQAQELLNDDLKRDGGLADSFLTVVTGIADIEESMSEQLTTAAVGKVGSLYKQVHKVLQDQVRLDTLDDTEREVIRAKAQYWNSLMRAHSLSPDSAVSGLYVTTTPRLGLSTVANSEPVA